MAKLSRAQLHNAVIAYIANAFHSQITAISEDMQLEDQLNFDNRAKIKLGGILKDMGVLSRTTSDEQIANCQTVGDLISLAYSEEK